MATPSIRPLSGLLPEGALPIGLGCSRLGSINGASGGEARALLNLALDQGVRFFDTSNIYAQGDSERLLADALSKRDDCIICSKAGKFLSWKQRALVPLKGAIRSLARRSDQARRGVAAARAKPMGTRWDAAFLAQSIDGSLTRLKRQHIDVFLLHGPSPEVMRRGDAMRALEIACDAGKLGLIGVSPDDVQTAEAALDDPRVRVLQLPIRPGEAEFDVVIQRAANNGVSVIAREILGGNAAIAGAVDPSAYAHQRIVDVIRMSQVDLTLIGTTRIANLTASTRAARSIGGSGR